MGFHVGEEVGGRVVGGSGVLEVRVEFDLVDRGRGGGGGEGGFEVGDEVVGDADGEGFAGGFDGFHGVPGGLEGGGGGGGGEEGGVDEVSVWEGMGGISGCSFLGRGEGGGGRGAFQCCWCSLEGRRLEVAFRCRTGEEHTGQHSPTVIFSSSAQSQQGYPRYF